MPRYRPMHHGWRDRLAALLHNIADRINGKSRRYAVIYDYWSPEDATDPEEHWYGWFSDEAEADRLFNDCYPPGAETQADNAWLVRVEKQLRSAREY